MNKNNIKVNVELNGTGGLIKTDEGQHPFSSRLFVNDRWLAVPLQDQKNISHFPLEIKWSRKSIAPCWVSLKAELTNKGREPVRLGSFHIMEGGKLGTDASDPVVFLDSAGGWFAGAVKGKASCPPYMEKWESYFIAEEDIRWAKELMGGKLEAGAHHSQAGLMVYYRGKGLPAWMLSFVVPMARCSAAPLLLVDPQTGGVRAFALVNNFAGYELSPGESIATETILLGKFSDPHAALETWADTCAKIRKLKVYPKPPAGWLSWYGYRLTQNETDTLRTVDLIKNEFDGLGFKYMQLDLGYNKGDLPGNWFEVNERYPRGLKYLADEFSKRGFKLGVWVSPVVLAADCTFAQEHPEALIRLHPKDAPGRWYWEPHCELFELDPTHPEGKKFLRRIIRHFKAMGVSYFKFDFMNRMGRVDPAFTPHDKRKVKGIEVYRHAQKIIMEEMSKDDYVYWCSNLIHYGIGMGSTSMTAADIGNTGFETNEKLAFFRQQATTTIARYYLHEQMLRLNPDSLHVAPPADIEECRIRATLVAMSGGQMFLGDRFDLSEKDRFEIIRQVTPAYGHVARPVDLFEHVYPEAHPRIWHLRVDTGWDQRDIVALMNCEHDMTIEVDLKRLGLAPDKEYYAWEFWEQKYFGRIKYKFSMKLKCPSSRLMGIVPARDCPWVLSTSFHVSQGGCDLAEVKWDEKRGVLSGVLLRPRGMKGNIFITVPPSHHCTLKQVAPDVYCLPITAESARTQWSAIFSK
ncbi:MAG: alpha-galactosidase [Verrucomicrobia bacterium]|nr:alpha-galactosidase [Verrucomicrobiota bacterium]MBU1856160.1 alpha-galactosidase [Verrucomicrobiota bacterium]